MPFTLQKMETRRIHPSPKRNRDVRQSHINLNRFSEGHQSGVSKYNSEPYNKTAVGINKNSSVGPKWQNEKAHCKSTKVCKSKNTRKWEKERAPTEVQANICTPNEPKSEVKKTIKLTNSATIKTCEKSTSPRISQNNVSNCPKRLRRSSSGKERSKRYHNRKRKRRSLELLGKYRKKKLRSDRADELWEGLPFNLQMPRNRVFIEPHSTKWTSKSEGHFENVPENARNDIPIQDCPEHVPENEKHISDQNLNQNNSNERDPKPTPAKSHPFEKSNSDVAKCESHDESVEPVILNTENGETELNQTFTVCTNQKWRRRPRRKRQRRRRNGRGKICSKTILPIISVPEPCTNPSNNGNQSKHEETSSITGDQCENPDGIFHKNSNPGNDKKDTSAGSSMRKETVRPGEDMRKGWRRSTRIRKPNLQKGDVEPVNQGKITEIKSDYRSEVKARYSGNRSKSKPEAGKIKKTPFESDGLPIATISSESRGNDQMIQKDQNDRRKKVESDKSVSRRTGNSKGNNGILRVQLPSINRALRAVKQKKTKHNNRNKKCVQPKPVVSGDRQQMQETDVKSKITRVSFNKMNDSKIAIKSKESSPSTCAPLVVNSKKQCSLQQRFRKTIESKKHNSSKNASPSKSAPLMVKSRKALSLQQKMLSPDSKRHHVRTPSVEALTTDNTVSTCNLTSSSGSNTLECSLSKSSAPNVQEPAPKRHMTRRQSLEAGNQSLLPGLPGPSPEKKKEVAPSYTNLLADVRLGIHACSLWSSENRRYYHLKNPKASSDVLDDLMRGCWSKLSQKEKLPFYKRAYHATNDRNKHSVLAASRITYKPDPPRAEPPSDLPKDPFFSLPVQQQEKTLFNKLMQFQRILPAKQYDSFLQEFVTSFKRTIENDNKIKGGSDRDAVTTQTYRENVSRKLLYEKLKQYEGFVLEVKAHRQYLVYKRNKLRYDELLWKIIRGEHVEFSDTVKSERLTQVLEAIDNVEQREAIDSVEQKVAIDNVEQKEAIDNVDQKEAIDNCEQKGAICNDEQREAIDNVGQKKAIDNVGQKEVIDNVKQIKAISNVEQKEAMDNVDQKNVIVNVECTQAINNVEKKEAILNVEPEQAIHHKSAIQLIDRKENKVDIGNVQKKLANDHVEEKFCTDAVERKNTSDSAERKDAADIIERKASTKNTENKARHTVKIAEASDNVTVLGEDVSRDLKRQGRVGCMVMRETEKRAVLDIAEELKFDSITGSTTVVIGNERVLLPRISVGSVLNNQLLADLNHNVSLPRMDHSDLQTYFQDLDQMPSILNTDFCF